MNNGNWRNNQVDKIDINKLDLSGFNASIRPTRNMINSIQCQHEENVRAVENNIREKEAEELRRHNELIATLKEAGKKGATIVVGDNANGVQIQQNSAGALQEMDNVQSFDYEKAYEILNEIRTYFEYPQFSQTFGDNTNNVIQVIVDTMEAIKNKDDEGLIKKSLHVIRDLAVGATESMISSGMLALLGQLQI